MTNPMIKFETATREKLKASIMIEGLSGRGKSGLALILARGLCDSWDDVFAIDTENKSVNLFAGIPSSTGENFQGFKTGQLTADFGFKPSNYLAFREAAIQAGAQAVIEDSISHAWQYAGGILDLVTQAKANNARYAKDAYAAWSDPTVSKEKNELLQLLRDNRVHVISTVRVKEKMEYTTDATGATKLVSLGEQQIQQADLKYEPDLVLHMLSPGGVIDGKTVHPVARVVKSRYAIFQKDKEYEFTPELIAQLKKYLEEGVDPAVLLEEQRQDYVKAMKEFLDSNATAVPIWRVMKNDAGFKDTPLEDMPLNALKDLFIRLTT